MLYLRYAKKKNSHNKPNNRDGRECRFFAYIKASIVNSVGAFLFVMGFFFHAFFSPSYKRKTDRFIIFRHRHNSTALPPADLCVGQCGTFIDNKEQYTGMPTGFNCFELLFKLFLTGHRLFKT